jgi:hypothetical protein
VCDSANYPGRAVVLLRSCDSLNPSLDHSFVMFQRFRIEEDNSRGQLVTLDAMSLVQVEHHEFEMEKHMELTHMAVTNFWNAVTRVPFSNKKCSTYSSEVQLHSISVFEHFQDCTNVQETPEILRKFAAFCSLTMNNQWRGDALLRRADVIEEEIVVRNREILEEFAKADVSGGGADVSIKNIMASGKVCVIVFGAEEHNFGIVKEAGKRLKEFLGVNPSDLIGKNINVIIPEPFASAHDSMLRMFIKSGKGAFSGKTRTVPAINQRGYLQNIQLTLAKNQVRTSFFRCVRSSLVF